MEAGEDFRIIKRIMKIIILGTLFLMNLNYVRAEAVLNASIKDEENYDLIRKQSFESLVYTRSWSAWIWRLKFGNENPEVKVSIEKSMVAHAFNYWILTKKKLIDSVPVYEMQIRKSFSEGDIPLERLNDPLSAPYGIAGPQLAKDDYQKLALEFKRFISLANHDLGTDKPSSPE